MTEPADLDNKPPKRTAWVWQKLSAIADFALFHWRRVTATPRWQRIEANVRTWAHWSHDMFVPVEGAPSQETDIGFMSTGDLIAKGRIIILVFFVVLMGWAALAPLESAVMAQGVVVVESHRKAIQHLEGGIVRDILVTDGQEVAAGQLLMRLDDTQARASLDLLNGQSDAYAAQEARLIAERDGHDKIEFPASLVARSSDPKVASAMAGEESTFQARRQTLAKQIAILGQRNGENVRIIAGLKSQQSAVERQIDLMTREIASVQTLYDKGLSTLPRLLALQRQAADLTGQRGQMIQKIAETQLSTGENELQMMNLRNQQLSDVVKDLRDVQTKRFDLLERVHAATDILARLTLTAPVSGKIVELAVHTKGAVVRPGDVLMEVVPRKDVLEVEAHVRPEDRDQVHIGMPARISFSGYRQRRVPSIEGIVNNISADRLVDAHTAQAYFNVSVTVDRSPLKNYPEMRIVPGLPVEVAFNTGSRTALGYFVEPITDVFRRGMREK